jgi:hypothetical protein
MCYFFFTNVKSRKFLVDKKRLVNIVGCNKTLCWCIFKLHLPKTVCTGYAVFVLRKIDMIIYFVLILSIVQGLASCGPQIGDIKRKGMMQNVKI